MAAAARAAAPLRAVPLRRRHVMISLDQPNVEVLSGNDVIASVDGQRLDADAKEFGFDVTMWDGTTSLLLFALDLLSAEEAIDIAAGILHPGSDKNSSTSIVAQAVFDCDSIRLLYERLPQRATDVRRRLSTALEEAIRLVYGIELDGSLPAWRVPSIPSPTQAHAAPDFPSVPMTAFFERFHHADAQIMLAPARLKLSINAAAGRISVPKRSSLCMSLMYEMTHWDGSRVLDGDAVSIPCYEAVVWKFNHDESAQQQAIEQFPGLAWLAEAARFVTVLRWARQKGLLAGALDANNNIMSVPHIRTIPRDLSLFFSGMHASLLPVTRAWRGAQLSVLERVAPTAPLLYTHALVTMAEEYSRGASVNSARVAAQLFMRALICLRRGTAPADALSPPRSSSDIEAWRSSSAWINAAARAWIGLGTLLAKHERLLYIMPELSAVVSLLGEDAPQSASALSLALFRQAQKVCVGERQDLLLSRVYGVFVGLSAPAPPSSAGPQPADDARDAHKHLARGWEALFACCAHTADATAAVTRLIDHVKLSPATSSALVAVVAPHVERAAANIVITEDDAARIEVARGILETVRADAHLMSDDYVTCMSGYNAALTRFLAVGAAPQFLCAIYARLQFIHYSRHLEAVLAWADKELDALTSVHAAGGASLALPASLSRPLTLLDALLELSAVLPNQAAQAVARAAKLLSEQCAVVSALPNAAHYSMYFERLAARYDQYARETEATKWADLFVKLCLNEPTYRLAPPADTCVFGGPPRQAASASMSL